MAEIVLTLTGPDRVGIVEEVTAALLQLGGNVETSRMARLGGDFAMLMLVSLPDEKTAAAEEGLRHFVAEGYSLAVRATEPTEPRGAGYRIDVEGADHEGIIHEISAGLSGRGINIESMDTTTSPAPVSGSPLFSMTAVVSVPAGLAEQDWEAELQRAAHESNVDVKVRPLP